MSEEVLDSLWIEKYRPKTLDDMSLPERYTQDFKRVIERGSMPNFLFSGPPGGGKTTLALILASKQGVLFNKKDNLLTANGSSKKGRSINFVDQVVEPFRKHPPAGGDKYKIVFMDEADNITPDAYDSWRGVIEKYHKEYGRFIWTCNYVSKIPDPVQSRFTPYIFQQIPKEFVEKYAKTIMASENIEYTDKDITFVVNQLYPDVRKIVNILQRCSYDGKLVVDRDAVVTSEKILISHIIEIVSLIAKNEENKIGAIINSIIDILAKQDLEYRNIYTELFYMKTLPAQAKIIVNKAANSHQACLIPHMHFMAMVFDIIKSLQAYKKAMMGK
jgi:replication factor C small subunit